MADEIERFFKHCVTEELYQFMFYVLDNDIYGLPTCIATSLYA